MSEEVAASPPDVVAEDVDADPDRLEVLGAFIREQRRQGRLSMRKLAELSGVSNPYLSQIERGLRKPSADILQQLAKALSVSTEALYVQAGILPDRRAGVDVVAEILRDELISGDQRQALIEVYRAFRAQAGHPVVATDPADPESSGTSQRSNEP